MGTPLMDVVSARRSIRRYASAPVEDEKLRACLEAARLAPSACNSQPWKMVVVDDPDTRKAFCAAAFSGIYSVTSFAAKAPVIAAIVCERPSLSSWVGNKLQDVDFRLVDIGIACSHFVNEARAQGLGTCIIGWFNREGAAKALKVPSGKRVELLVSVGYPDENPEPRPRRSIEDIFSRNRY